MSTQLDPNQYREILESLPNGIYVVDPARKILFWNDGAERITGYLRQDVIGRSCPENLLRHCDDNYVCLCDRGCPLQATICDGKSREANVYLRHKEGRLVPVRVRSVPIRDPQGTIIGAAESFDERYPALEVKLHTHAQAVQKRLGGQTGVSDRDSVRSYIEACLRDFAEDHNPFGVLSIAVDEMAEFRKAHGAQAADKVLHTVADTLSKNVPPGDIVGSWAENRLVAILIDCEAASLTRVANLLQHIVEHAAIPWWGDRLSVTISVGGTTARAEDTPESLLGRAERALLSAVKKGSAEVI